MNAPGISIRAGGLDDVDHILDFWLQAAEGPTTRLTRQGDRFPPPRPGTLLPAEFPTQLGKPSII